MLSRQGPAYQAFHRHGFTVTPKLHRHPKTPMPTAWQPIAWGEAQLNPRSRHIGFTEKFLNQLTNGLPFSEDL